MLNINKNNLFPFIVIHKPPSREVVINAYSLKVSQGIVWKIPGQSVLFNYHTCCILISIPVIIEDAWFFSNRRSCCPTWKYSLLSNKKLNLNAFMIPVVTGESEIVLKPLFWLPKAGVLPWLLRLYACIRQRLITISANSWIKENWSPKTAAQTANSVLNKRPFNQPVIR